MKREGKSQDRKVCSGTVEMVTEQTKPTVDVQALHGTKQKRFSRHKFYSWSTMDTLSLTDLTYREREGTCTRSAADLKYINRLFAWVLFQVPASSSQPIHSFCRWLGTQKDCSSSWILFFSIWKTIVARKGERIYKHTVLLRSGLNTKAFTILNRKDTETNRLGGKSEILYNYHDNLPVC